MTTSPTSNNNSPQGKNPHKDFNKLMGNYHQVHKDLQDEIHHTSGRVFLKHRGAYLSVLSLVLLLLVLGWLFNTSVQDKAIAAQPFHWQTLNVPEVKQLLPVKVVAKQQTPEPAAIQSNGQQIAPVPANNPTLPTQKDTITVEAKKEDLSTSPGLSKFVAASPTVGMAALYKYLREALQYPAEARKKQVGGKVWLRFEINTEGHVQNVTVVKGLGFGCDKEAIRIVQNMPLWHPAKLNGKPKETALKIPVVFNIDISLDEEIKK